MNVLSSPPRANRIRLVVVFLAAAGNLCLLPLADGGGGKKKNPNRQVVYLKKFEKKFELWDKDNDHSLDKAELAKAFRGPNAKPYDELKGTLVVPQKPTSVGPPIKARPKAYYVALVSFPRPSMPVQLAASELAMKSQSIPRETVPNPPVITSVPIDPSAFPDYQFLKTVSKNGDHKITKKEFTAWAKKLADVLDHHEDLEDNLQTQQNRLKKTKDAKTRASISREINRLQTDLAKTNAQLAAIPPAIRKALDVRP